MVPNREKNKFEDFEPAFCLRKDVAKENYNFTLFSLKNKTN